MKRRKRMRKAAKNTQSNDMPRSHDKPKPPMHRRDFFTNVALYSIGAFAIAGGGTYLTHDIMASAAEADLSTLGNGVPAVVQIHDPNCSQCTALQREARSAACEFDDGSLQFLVAGLQTTEGRRLANAHGVGSVTLLLFDGDGTMRSIISGPNSAENLRRAFAYHVDQYANRAT